MPRRSSLSTQRATLSPRKRVRDDRPISRGEYEDVPRREWLAIEACGHGLAWLLAVRDAGAPAASDSDASVPTEAPIPVADHRAAMLRWRHEAPDSSWTAEATQYLAASFRDLQIEAAVDEVSCRTTLCRALLVFDAVTEATRYAQEGASQSGIAG